MQQVASMLDQLEQTLPAGFVPVSAQPGIVPYPGDTPAAQTVREAPMNRGDYPEAAARYNGRRQREMDATMRAFEIQLELEYFMANGKQQFEYRGDSGDASRLIYSNQGQIPVAKAEIRLGRWALGGRYGANTLSREQCTDEDWNITMSVNGAPTLVDYTISTQDCSAKVAFYDANLYYTLLERDAADAKARETLMIDSYALDVFGGYQWYRGRYAMVDPMYERLLRIGETWYYQSSPALPAEIGLNSPYKITYQGPRAGLRLNGQAGRVSTDLSLALAYLKTKAHGYWNLRDYNFWQYGKGGYGIDMAVESTYALTPSWSAGLGYNYIGLYQKKMKESGTQPGLEFYEQDWIRKAYNQTYGFTFILKYIW